MQKVILITGATDGIGLATANMLASQGHHILIHGRNITKLDGVAKDLAALPGSGQIETFAADLSVLAEVERFADAVLQKHKKLDVLINNAGIYNVPNIATSDQLDTRFVVNTLAPYLLTQRLLPLFDNTGRIVNLSSAAQAPVDLNALATINSHAQDGPIYAQTKLALTMWSIDLAASIGQNGPAIIAVNPASFLGSKLVKEAYGVAGGDLNIGADVLSRAAISEEFANASGLYFDNDSGQFSKPHSDARDSNKNHQVKTKIEQILASKLDTYK